MFERFDDHSRKIMALANQEAQRFNHEFVGTEHLLLGLVKQYDSGGARVLKNLDVDLRKVRLEVEKLLKSGADMVTMGKLPQTPRAKKVIEYAIEEARDLNHTIIGSEHLLLGLMREQDGVAGQVLKSMSLDLNEVREEVLDILEVGEDVEEPEVDAASGEFRDHPAVRRYRAMIRELALAAEEARNQRRADEARLLARQIRKLRQTLRVLLSRLRRDPTFLLAETERVVKYCIAVQPFLGIPARATEVDAVAAALDAGRVVLVVGPAGSGRRTLAGAVQAALALSAGDRLGVQLVMPDHQALGGETPDGGYGGALAALAQEIHAGNRHVLAVPEFHCCVDPAMVTHDRADAWRMLTNHAVAARRPMLGLTTPQGLEGMSKNWPGLTAAAEVIRLSEPSARDLERVVSHRVAQLAGDRGLRFEGGFAKAVIDGRIRWSGRCPLADPGLSLGLLDAVVAFDEQQIGKSLPMPAPDPGTQAEKARLKRSVAAALQNDDFLGVGSLMRKLSRLAANTDRSAAAVEVPASRVVPVSRVAEFLASQGL